MGKTNLFVISKSRKALMGFATLYVALFHFTFDFSTNVFQAIKEYGNIGVEIFLFLSAIGLYFSMSKNENVLDFYKRRLSRILPFYLLVVIPFSVFRLAFGNDGSYGIGRCISSILTIDLWITGDRMFWFFSILFPLYFLYPLIYKLYKKNNLLFFIVTLAVSLLLNLFLSLFCKEFFNNTEVAFRRIPIFLFGAFCAKYIKEKKEISTIYVWGCLLLMIALMVAGMFFDIYSNRYLYIPLTLCMVFVLSVGFDKIGNSKFTKVFSWFGGISMEIYMLHGALVILFEKVALIMPETIRNIIINEYFKSIVSLIISVIAGYIISKAIDSVMKKIESKKTKES